MINLKRKNAQQVVEFLLIAPFVIAFLAFFTEYAYALNINLTLTKALKTSTAKLYQYAKPNVTQDEIASFVKSNFIKALEENGIPTKEENNIKVGCFKTEHAGIFMAQYTYYPAFSLPTIFFKIMPDKFNFMTTVPVPLALLKSNDYSGAVSTETLDTIHGANSFSNLADFDSIKKGFLKDTTSGRNKMLFLFPSEEFTDQEDTYLILNFDGEPVTTTKTVGEGDDTSTQSFHKVYSKNKTNLLECSVVEKTCSESDESLYNYISNNGKTYIYVIDKSSAESDTTSSNIKERWLDTTSDTDISQSSIHGILKNTIAIINTSTSAIGNYDMLDCSSNNEACASSSVTIRPFGSMIFIDSDDDIKNKVTAGKSRPDFSDFGG